MDTQHPGRDDEPIMAPFVAPHKGSPLKKIAVVVIILALLAGVAILAVSAVNKHHKSAASAVTKTAKTSTSVSVTHIAATTKHYDSDNFSLGFDYPQDWTVNDTDGARLTVTSPILQLKDSTNQAMNARIVMSIQHMQTTLSQFAANSAIAPLESQKITYKSPTPNQRAQTYVSFVNYGGGSQSIDALYVTGDNGYQVGQSIPMTDISHDDPLVSISFLKCTDTSCPATSAAASVAVSSWRDTALSKPLINLLESLTID